MKDLLSDTSHVFISVIIPVYNAEKYLARCLDSVVSQTFKHFEVILVNDGSKDDSGDICDAYEKKDDRFKVIHQENQGQSAARNHALDYLAERSDSKWIVFVDSDDKIHPRYLELLYRAVVETGCLVSGCNYKKVYQDTDFPALNSDSYQIITAETMYCDRTVSAVSPWSKLYARKCFESLRFPLYKFHEDEFVLYKTIFQSKKICYYDMPLYMNFATPDSVTRSPWHSDRLVKLDAIQEQIEFFRSHGYRRAYKRAVTYYASTAKTFISSAEKWKNRDDVKKLKKLLIRHLVKHIPCFVLACIHPSSVKREELS